MKISLDISTEESVEILSNLAALGQSIESQKITHPELVKSGGMDITFNPDTLPETPFTFSNLTGSDQDLEYISVFLAYSANFTVAELFLSSLEKWCKDNNQSKFLEQIRMVCSILSQDLSKEIVEINDNLDEPVIDPLKVFDPEEKGDIINE